MGLLYALESIRTPLLDKILGAVTYLGDEICFMVFAVGVFWCISKRMGYYLMTVGFFGTILNQFLKILCAIPRPWVKDPGFTIVESARAGASGYSFPSGHTQNAVTLYGGTARYTKTPWLRWVCIAVMVLICFSRMYLGVHTPLDVGVALAMGAVLVLALYPVMEEADRRPWVLTWVIGFMVVCSGAFVAYLYLRGDTGATAEDTANYVSALSNGWKFVGATLGLLATNILDRRYIRFDRAVRRRGGDRRRHPLSADRAVRRVRMAPDILGFQPLGKKIRKYKTAPAPMQTERGRCFTAW